MRNRLRVALAGPAVLLAMGLSAPASAAVHPATAHPGKAHSATALTATAACETHIVVESFQCTVTISGGTAPYSITWVADYHARITGGTHGATVSATCIPVQGTAVVEADVTDAAGSQATAYGSYPCSDH